MKLTDVMGSHGWSPYPIDRDYNKLKVYQKNNLLFGVQKIGNVFRVDVQQCMDFGGVMYPMSKLVDKEIIPLANLELTLNNLLPQLS